MIRGTGIDIVEVERIRKSVEKSEDFVKKVFSPAEVAYCQKEGVTAFQSYAGKFAAKEAFFKALGTGWRGKLAFDEVSVLNDDLGKPFISLSGKTLESLEYLKNCNLHLSISHTRQYATAMVIIETRSRDDENS